MRHAIAVVACLVFVGCPPNGKWAKDNQQRVEIRDLRNRIKIRDLNRNLKMLDGLPSNKCCAHECRVEDE